MFVCFSRKQMSGPYTCKIGLDFQCKIVNMFLSISLISSADPEGGTGGPDPPPPPLENHKLYGFL